MRFLIDQQLPKRLAAVLRELGHDAMHVKDLGMTEASDIEISAKAIEFGATIVTKDDDFVKLARIGPKVVWIRLGNCSNDVLYGRVRQSLDIVLEELETAQVAALASAP